MNSSYQGRDVIPASKDKVWAFITVPANIASCLPDVEQTTIMDDRNFAATVRVAVGPVRGTFKFKITLDPQPDGKSMGLRINGGGFGSVIDLKANADIGETGPNETTLDWQGQAEIRGPIATVGGPVVDAQAKRVITTTFGNIKTKITGAAAPA